MIESTISRCGESEVLFIVRQGYSNSKIGIRLIVIGGSIAVIGVVLVFFLFGLTFGTAGIITSGIFLSFYGITFTTTANRRLNFILSQARKLLSIMLLLGLISFMWAETLIFQSLKCNDNVNIKYAVILGAGIDGEQPSLTLSRRLDRSIEYLNANHNVKIVASGGRGPGAGISEAEVMKRYLVANGIDETRVLKEEKSTTSDENLKYTQELLSSLNGEQPQNILIITSDYHMFRAKHIASNYYPKVYGIASETPTPIMINYAVREYLAVIKLVILDMVYR